jgi:hypothetical protein
MYDEGRFAHSFIINPYFTQTNDVKACHVPYNGWIMPLGDILHIPSEDTYTVVYTHSSVLRLYC